MNIVKNNFRSVRASKPFPYLMIVLSAIFYTIAVQAFLNVAGTFTAGLGAFAQLLTFTVDGLNSYFSIIYIALNIPLIIIFWNKIKKKFIYRTTFFLIVQAAIGAIFLIPSVKDMFYGLMHASNTDTNLTGTENVNALRSAVWPIIVLSLMGAVSIGVAIAISWKFGGSTGGSDIVTYYYSTKKQKPIGAVMFVLSMGIVVFSFTITIILNPSSNPVRDNWLMLLVSTILYLLINSLIVNFVYPKYSKVRLEIFSEKPNKITKYLKEIKFNHSFYTSEIISGYNGKKKIVITSVVLLLEVRNIVRNLSSIDDKIWISETRVRRVFGNFNTAAVE